MGGHVHVLGVNQQKRLLNYSQVLRRRFEAPACLRAVDTPLQRRFGGPKYISPGPVFGHRVNKICAVDGIEQLRKGQRIAAPAREQLACHVVLD